MKTTIEFLNAVKVRYDLPSDGRLAAKLGLTRSAVSTFMAKKNALGDDTAMKVADLLDLDPAFVVACVHAERAKQPAEKKLWERMALQMTGIAATVLVAIALPAPNANAVTFTNVHNSGTLYIMSNVWRAIRKRFKAFHGDHLRYALH